MTKDNKGNSLLEIIVALAIFILFASTLASMILGNLSLNTSSAKHTEAGFLAQETMEALHSIKERAWNELNLNSSAIEQSGDTWILSGEASSEQIRDFTRYVEFSDVYRNPDGEIVSATSSNAALDTMSKIAKVNVEWLNSRNKIVKVKMSTLLTNWRSENWEQSDWSGGEGQELWSNEDRYYHNDGNIDHRNHGELSLIEVSTSTYANIGTLESSAFFMGEYSHANAIWWEDMIDNDCSDCKIELRIKTATDNYGSPGPWSDTWCGPEGKDGDSSDFFSASSSKNIIHPDHNSDQWIKYQVTLSGDTIKSPLLKKVMINYKR